MCSLYKNNDDLTPGENIVLNMKHLEELGYKVPRYSEEELEKIDQRYFEHIGRLFHEASKKIRNEQIKKEELLDEMIRIETSSRPIN